jgi:hypothetical protein
MPTVELPNRGTVGPINGLETLRRRLSLPMERPSTFQRYVAFLRGRLPVVSQT